MSMLVTRFDRVEVDRLAMLPTYRVTNAWEEARRLQEGWAELGWTAENHDDVREWARPCRDRGCVVALHDQGPVTYLRHGEAIARIEGIFAGLFPDGELLAAVLAWTAAVHAAEDAARAPLAVGA